MPYGTELYWSLNQKEKSVILILSPFKILISCSSWILFGINFYFWKNCMTILCILITVFFGAPLNCVLIGEYFTFLTPILALLAGAAS